MDTMKYIFFAMMVLFFTNAYYSFLFSELGWMTLHSFFGLFFFREWRISARKEKVHYLDNKA